jgi:NAD(P)-dependent dehydrogenase (short-subunit alcohol dehydrogenase family)
MTLPDRPVWLITGCSTGFGRDLARLTAERGWPTVVTARDVSRVADLAEGHPDVLPLALDVTDAAQVAEAVRAATERFGRIDVLVNNAGYGYQASIEEAEDKEIRAQFEANVFGLFAMTRAVLPGMRERRAGHIINITSVAGLIGFPGSGYYAASKHAVEGFSDALSAEVTPLGIHVTCVEPGPFRTDWAGRSLKQTPSRLPDYADTVAARMKSTSENSGTQAGDPLRAGEAMIQLTQDSEPPARIVLGKWGYDAVLKAMTERVAQIERLRETSVGTDFPA